MAVIKEKDIKLPVNAICRVEHEGTTSFVYQAPGNSELTTNTQTDVLHWSLRVTVGNAIEYTPAAYVMYRSNYADNRIIFCVSFDSILQNYEFDLLDAVWKPGLLQKLKLPVLEDSYMTALWDGSNLRVYYQGEDKKIREVLSDGLEGAWEVGATFHKASRPVPLAAYKGNGPLRLFYGQDRGIGQLLFDGKEWNNSRIPVSSSFQNRKPFEVQENESGEITLYTIEAPTE
ncbi:uncharacterized protein BDR25DRAFT_346715 [Lindgomyces ingoldianus]|uniref:Uncharacterized protein n=1 Tax=Lindgomyces ingoldianus TaxID=673940 RepID=A0ACB6QBR4_9PLEO|nr:uncharacterized protein BDR25DRAFT_346715 [Lindgomyces ingoldianus]KAF2464379.1 hypothetical protein BDR25DRAFT_346715 [Lindgomyces ingoldianus]